MTKKTTLRDLIKKAAKENKPLEGIDLLGSARNFLKVLDELEKTTSKKKTKKKKTSKK
jgi:hypothetical protein